MSETHTNAVHDDDESCETLGHEWFPYTGPIGAAGDRSYRCVHCLQWNTRVFIVTEDYS